MDRRCFGVLFLVWKIIAAWNAPAVEKENTEQAKEQTERIEARGRKVARTVLHSETSGENGFSIARKITGSF